MVILHELLLQILCIHYSHNIDVKIEEQETNL